MKIPTSEIIDLALEATFKDEEKFNYFGLS
jgi:hypothetical protein